MTEQTKPLASGICVIGGTVYEDGKVFATVHPGQPDPEEAARRIAWALEYAAFDEMQSPLMMAD